MLRLLIDLIRHARCRRAIPRRINECICRIETHLFQKRERLLMHLFRFSREASDEIGRQHDVRHLFTNVGNKLLEMLDRISAIHLFQHFI